MTRTAIAFQFTTAACVAHVVAFFFNFFKLSLKLFFVFLLYYNFFFCFCCFSEAFSSKLLNFFIR